MRHLFILLALFFAMHTSAQVRNCKWGWPKDSVRKVEKGNLLQQTKDFLLYSTSINSSNYDVQYDFVENKLARITMVYKENHLDANRYIAEYRNLRRILLEKYPLVKRDDEKWSEERYKERPSDHGLALTMGHVTYFLLSESNDTQVALILTGDNFNATMGIQYDSKELGGEIERRRKEAISSEF